MFQNKANIQDNYKAGICFIIINTIFFSLIAVLVKQVRHLPLMEIIFFRSMPTMIIIPFMIKKNNISFWGNNKFSLWFRSLSVVIGMIALFYTYTVMSLTDAISLQQLGPFFTCFLAGIFLKEKLHFRQLPFFIFAFLGALLIIKPGLRIDMFPALIALVSAIFVAASQVTLRHLRLTDHYLVIVNYLAYILGMVSLTILLVQNSFQLPSLSDLFFLFLLGGLALLSQITLTKAYQLAPANLVSLYTYAQIIFVSLFELIFFEDLPDIMTIIGAIFIIISGYLNYKYKKNNNSI